MQPGDTLDSAFDTSELFPINAASVPLPMSPPAPAASPECADLANEDTALCLCDDYWKGTTERLNRHWCNICSGRIPFIDCSADLEVLPHRERMDWHWLDAKRIKGAKKVRWQCGECLRAGLPSLHSSQTKGDQRFPKPQCRRWCAKRGCVDAEQKCSCVRPPRTRPGRNAAPGTLGPLSNLWQPCGPPMARAAYSPRGVLIVLKL